mmetsp:Transcript_28824/g.73056  ORF Transcript_28824/g.73056 Transcript_28824/m.73056 type:complete len:223 (-) Transcript_28824:1447-2115(-)
MGLHRREGKVPVCPRLSSDCDPRSPPRGVRAEGRCLGRRSRSSCVASQRHAGGSTVPRSLHGDGACGGVRRAAKDRSVAVVAAVRPSPTIPRGPCGGVVAHRARERGQRSLQSGPRRLWHRHRVPTCCGRPPPARASRVAQQHARLRAKHCVHWRAFAASAALPEPPRPADAHGRQLRRPGQQRGRARHTRAANVRSSQPGLTPPRARGCDCAVGHVTPTGA